MTTSSRTSPAPHAPSPVSFIERALIFFLCLAFMLVLKFPYFGLPLLYYDDGETLYHVFALLHGQLPYRDIYTHHFTGYVLPIAALAELFGYSIDLIRQSFILNQALLGLGTYLCARIFFDRKRSTIGALLAVSAREPFVYSFFPLSQVSCAGVFILWLALRYLDKPSIRLLAFASILSGAAFVIDQRGLLLLLIPLLSLLLAKNQASHSFPMRAIFSLLLFSLIPALVLALLWHLGILESFINQTIVFPARFRAASLSLKDKIFVALSMHRYLVIETPILSALALAGCSRILTLKRNTTAEARNSQLTLLLFLPLILFAIAALGGRDFSYYTIPWLPWLALTALFSADLLTKSVLMQRVGQFLLFSPLLIVALSFTRLIDFTPELAKRDDALQIADYIRSHIQPGETLFVFGYRPDIYASIPMLSASPLVNVIYVHPDSLIKTYDQRLAHIDPDIEQEFMQWLKNSPPTWMVVVELPVGEADSSPAATAVKETVLKRYSLAVKTAGPLVEGKALTVLLYRIQPQSSVLK